MKNIICLIVFLTFTFSCQVKRVDTTEVKKRMKDYKVRRVSDADLLFAAETWGQELKKSISQQPQLYCDTTFTFQEVAVQLLYQPLKLKDSNPKLQKILEAYQYSLTQNQIIPDNLQQINDSTVLYSYQNQVKIGTCKPAIVFLYLPQRILLRKIQ